MQHLNTGELLPSGHSTIGWAYTYRTLPTCSYNGSTPEPVQVDGRATCPSDGGVSQMKVPALGRSVRIGIDDRPLGPFRGWEIGYQLEFPETLEFDVKAGLPSPGPLMHHSISLGWGLGLWPDNSYFAEYAVSWRPSPAVQVYGNFRETLVATQAIDLSFNGETTGDGSLFDHDRRWLHQLAFGFQGTIGEHFMIPDYWNLQAMVSAPVMGLPTEPSFSGNTAGLFQPAVTLGIGWYYRK
jgi:hypothetical protein